MSPAEARRTARRDFGGIEQTKEAARDARGWRGLEDAGADLRYGARLLRRNPGVAAAATLTFALGIGAATAIFTLIYGVLLRPLPYERPDRLVVLWEHDLTRGHTPNVVAADNFEAWRRRAESFASMSAVVPTTMTLAGQGQAERLVGAEVTPEY